MTKLFLEFEPDTVPFTGYVRHLLSINITVYLSYPTQITEQYELIIKDDDIPMAKGENNSLTIYVNPDELKNPNPVSDEVTNWINPVPPFKEAKISAKATVIHDGKTIQLHESQLQAAGITGI